MISSISLVNNSVKGSLTIGKGDKGDRGDSVEFRATETHIQYRYQNETFWIDLILLSELKGAQGESFKYADFTHEQLLMLKGEKGIQGERGIQGIQGEQGERGIQGEQGLKGDKGDTPSIAHLESQVSTKLNEVDTVISKVNTNESDRQDRFTKLEQNSDNKINEVDTSKNNMLSTVSDSLEGFEKRFTELENDNPIGELTSARKSTDGTIKANLSERLTYDFDKKSNVGDSYLKDETYNRGEIDNAIANVEVDLSGYETIANNDNKLKTKVDTVEGKTLTSNDFTNVLKTKLEGLSNYTHPASHPANIISQDASNRFVTDAEKTSWNAKSNFDGNYNSLSNKPSIPTVDITKKYVDDELAKKSNNHDHPYKASNYVPTWDEVTSKPTNFNPTSHRHNASEVDNITVVSNASDVTYNKNNCENVDIALDKLFTELNGQRVRGINISNKLLDMLI